ncbi:MAG: hypothetical protein WC538_22040 [Thermoanaerobaculia bacterium]|jgi:hypothetical protein
MRISAGNWIGIALFTIIFINLIIIGTIAIREQGAVAVTSRPQPLLTAPAALPPQPIAPAPAPSPLRAAPVRVETFSAASMPTNLCAATLVTPGPLRAERIKIVYRGGSYLSDPIPITEALYAPTITVKWTGVPCDIRREEIKWYAETTATHGPFDVGAK